MSRRQSFGEKRGFKNQFHEADGYVTYRNNDRIAIDDPEFAEVSAGRIRYLPKHPANADRHAITRPCDARARENKDYLKMTTTRSIHKISTKRS